MKQITILLVLFLGLTNGSDVKNEFCPTAEPTDNFDLNSFSEGIWYEYGRYPTKYQKYSNAVGYRGQHTKDNVYRFKMVDIPEDSPQYFELEFSLDENYNKTGDINAKVLFGNSKEYSYKTKCVLYDPKRYILAYTCSYDENKTKIYENAWVSIRTQKPTAEVKAAIEDFIKSSKYLDFDRFVWANVDQ